MSRSCFSERLNISDAELTEAIARFAIFVPMPLIRLRAIVSISSWFIIYIFCLCVKDNRFFWFSVFFRREDEYDDRWRETEEKGRKRKKRDEKGQWVLGWVYFCGRKMTNEK